MYLKTKEDEELIEDLKELYATFKEHPFIIILSAIIIYFGTVIILL